MLFRWLAPAIRIVEGAGIDAETFESGYFSKYETALRNAESSLGWSAEKQATAYGQYQILGENLARFHGLGVEHLDRFLSDPAMQYQVARKQFYIMLQKLILRRGLSWPAYLFSMWNAGVNYNDSYSKAIKRALKG